MTGTESLSEALYGLLCGSGDDLSDVIDGLPDHVWGEDGEIEKGRAGELAERARQIARKRAGRLIAEIEESKRLTIQRIINRGMKNKWSKKKISGFIFSHVGLTKRQQSAVENYRLNLIKQGVSAGVARKLYRERVIAERRTRARLIADQEIFAARSQAKRERWSELVEKGKLSPKWKRKWVTAEDERTCPFCAPLHGMTIGIDDVYSMKGRTYSGPPIHPKCRCEEKLELEKS